MHRFDPWPGKIGATEAPAPKPLSLCSRAQDLQLEYPEAHDPLQEKPPVRSLHRNTVAPAYCSQRKPSGSDEDPAPPKIKPVHKNLRFSSQTTHLWSKVLFLLLHLVKQMLQNFLRLIAEVPQGRGRQNFSAPIFLNASINTLNVSEQRSSFFTKSSVCYKLQGINVLLSPAYTWLLVCEGCVQTEQTG